MIIEELSLRGFKSFGNNFQTIKFDTKKGQLNLLTGNNGMGKSSIIQTIEYLFFNKVRGKKKSWQPLSTLPNRLTGQLEGIIKFVADGVNVKITRGIGPNILFLEENGVDLNKAGKSNVNDKIEKYIGMDIDTFTGFISMSVNDFKNFISLSNEEKKLLLDKLFNLEAITVLNGILKDLNKENKKVNEVLFREISMLEDSINSIQRSIDISKQKMDLAIDSEIETLKIIALEKKSLYDEVKERKEKIDAKKQEIEKRLDIDKEGIITLNNELRGIEKELSLYSSGKCPTCASDLTTTEHLSYKGTIEEKKHGLNKIKTETENSFTSLKEKKNKLFEMEQTTNKSFTTLQFELRDLKNKIEKLKIEQNDKVQDSIKEFLVSIDELNIKKEIKKDEMINISDKEIYFKEIAKILSDDGVKKVIITNIILPINKFIADNVKFLHLPFMVELDDTFSAKIVSLGNEIDPDSLSTGEHKKISLCILIAYLKLIKSKKNFNILFLDEIFSSIDIESIDYLIDLLKDFATEFKTNVFLVHHAILNQEKFDKIYKITKNVFSQIEEIERN